MTKKCKTVNIPAVQEHNSLKALGGWWENTRPSLPFPSLLQVPAAGPSSDNATIVRLLVNQQAAHNWPHLNIPKQKAVAEMHLNFSPRFKLPAKVSFSLMFAVRIVSRWVHLIRSSRSGWSVISTQSTSLCFPC